MQSPLQLLLVHQAMLAPQQGERFVTSKKNGLKGLLTYFLGYVAKDVVVN